MTKNDIEQLDQLIQKRLKAEIKPLHDRFDLHEERFSAIERSLSAKISRVEKGLSDRIGSVEKNLYVEISRVEKNLYVEIKRVETSLTAKINHLSDEIIRVEKELSVKISREVRDIASMIRDVIIPKLEKHDEQILELQEVTGLKQRKH